VVLEEAAEGAGRRRALIGFDLLILGAVLGVGGSVLLGKSNLAPSYPDDLASTFWGSNPFQLRNLIKQRYDAIAGAIWLGLSLLALASGTIWATANTSLGPFSDLVIHTLVLLLVGSCGVWGTIVFSNRISRKIYLPQMIAMQREVFEQAWSVIENDGLYKTEVQQSATISPEVRRQRRTDATRQLNQIGKLIDLPRKPNESDNEYLRRIEPFFYN